MIWENSDSFAYRRSTPAGGYLCTIQLETDTFPEMMARIDVTGVIISHRK
jgi:hypothetical protein